ncbi:uncharacterized protein Dana_GF14782 [Drosophila ananassae]|uniref:Ataxin-2 C-terminal domain-containing protein n=1 Tax=Drosophila ananassae TaxID=7217 RepID=B3MMK6_DROAN|nr:uncharacterized protein LOC6497601 [Drosophila ananassae]EDV30952.1 uncharacterized protein Dana_GF14782 [Drosophila ananassae]
MSNGGDRNSFNELEREVGGAESPPPAELPRPPPHSRRLATDQEVVSAALTPPAAGSRSRTLDTRLNPNAPIFVPTFKVDLMAGKLYNDLAPYTRWSTASSEDLSYGPRFESIWRESSLMHQDMVMGDEEEEILQLLEEDEQQAMNVGAESYDPKQRRITLTQTNILDVVGGLPPQLPESQQQLDLLAEERSGEGRASRSGGGCCAACLLM